MRVIQANKYHFVKGGADRYYLDLVAGQSRHGHDVAVLTMAHPRNLDLPHGSVQMPEVDYHAPMSWGRKVREGSRVVFSLAAYGLAKQQVRSHRPDVVHLHNIYHQISPSIIWAFRRSRIPMVMTVHDYKLVCPGYILHSAGEICERCRHRAFHHAIARRCVLASREASTVAAVESSLHHAIGTYRGVSLFLCPSRFMLEKLAEFGIPRQRLRHVPYHLPSRDFVATAPPESGRCVFAGRLSREKGLFTLLAAMRRLSGRPLTLDIVGEGPLRTELEAAAAAWCPGRVRFLGYLQGAALRQAVCGADFAVLPAEYYENLPYGILEPFAYGRPVVASRVGGIPELVRDGDTGRLFEMGNDADLADALAWMSAPATDRAALGRGARAQIDTVHDEARHLADLDAIYREVGA